MPRLPVSSAASSGGSPLVVPPPLAFCDPEFRLDFSRVVVVVAHLGGYRLAAVSAR